MAQDFRTTKRRWIKLYPSESLHGSIRYQLTSAERGVWYDLLCFSSLCSNTGDICDRDGEPFPLTYIANRLNITLSLLKATVESCLIEGRLIQDDNGLHIKNWSRYQSEFDRQKPFREAKKSKHDEELARQKAYQERVAKMSPEESSAETKRLSDEYDRLHPHGKEPLEDEQGMREHFADLNDP